MTARCSEWPSQKSTASWQETQCSLGHHKGTGTVPTDCHKHTDFGWCPMNKKGCLNGEWTPEGRSQAKMDEMDIPTCSFSTSMPNSSWEDLASALKITGVSWKAWVVLTLEWAELWARGKWPRSSYRVSLTHQRGLGSSVTCSRPRPVYILSAPALLSNAEDLAQTLSFISGLWQQLRFDCSTSVNFLVWV